MLSDKMESSPDDFPTMPESTTNRSQVLEASASMSWTLLFLAYSSSTFLSEFSHGWVSLWTILFVLLPLCLAGMPNIMDKRPKAISILLTYVMYALMPALLQLWKPTTGPLYDLCDALTIIVIWAPLELKLLSPKLSPTGKVSEWGLLTACLTIVNTFSVLRPLPRTNDLGYTFKLTIFDIATSLAFSVPAVAAVIPIALYTKFAKLRRNFTSFTQNPSKELIVFIGLYMRALTEELLFRSLIHNLLSLRIPAYPIVPIVVSSFAFAVAHVSKSKFGTTPPNLKLALCAFVASLFYASVWQFTSKVTAAAITNTMVDFILYRVVLSDPVRS